MLGTDGPGEGGSSAMQLEPLHRPWQRGGGAVRAHRGRWRRADDPDADLAVRHQAILRDLQRPGRRRLDAARGRGRAPVQGHGEPAPGGLDRGRLGADGVLRLVPAARLGNSAAAEQKVEIILGAALLVGAPPWCSATSWTAGPASGGSARSSDVAGPPGADRPDRHDRGADRGPDLGGLRLADDRPDAVPVPAAQRRRAGRDRPDPGGSAHRGGGPGSAGLRPCRVRA